MKNKEKVWNNGKKFFSKLHQLLLLYYYAELKISSKCRHQILHLACMSTCMNLMGSIKLPRVATDKCIRQHSFLLYFNYAISSSSSIRKLAVDVMLIINIVICKY